MTFSNQKSFDSVEQFFPVNVAARACLLAELDRLMQENAMHMNATHMNALPATRALADIPEHLFSTDEARLATAAIACR